MVLYAKESDFIVNVSKSRKKDLQLKMNCIQKTTFEVASKEDI